MKGELTTFLNSSSSCADHLNLKRILDMKPLMKFYQCRNEAAFMHFILEESERELLRELHSIRPLLAFYLCLMAFGAVGNALLACVVARRRKQHTVTDVLILNLAVSDFILCTVTQPFNIRRLFFSNHSWESGLALCKIVHALTGLNLFVSTFSVTAIALDRCRVVLQLTPDPPATRGCRLVLLAIWLAAMLVTSPMLFFAEIANDETRLSGEHKACVERTASQADKALKVAYSSASLCLQYAVPLVVLTCAFARIRARLARRLRDGQLRCRRSLTPLQRMRRLLEERRHRRANALLAAGAVVFGLSWLPLSVFNTLLDVKLMQIDVHDPMDFLAAEGRIRGADLGYSAFAAQGLCLLSVLASACINPILYGFFNENFRRELIELICCCCHRRSNPHRRSCGRQSRATAADREAAESPREDISESPQLMESRL